MEDFFNYVTQKWNVDLIIVVLVFLSGFFQEKYLAAFVWSKDSRYDSALKTLTVSLIVGITYAILSYYNTKADIKASDHPDMAAVVPFKKYFISYFAATSLYDLAIRPFRNFIKKKFGDTDPDPAPVPKNP